MSHRFPLTPASIKADQHPLSQKLWFRSVCTLARLFSEEVVNINKLMLANTKPRYSSMTCWRMAGQTGRP